MDLIAIAQAVVLGLVEGMTEFIPVSSTGHLILGAELLGFTNEGSIAFKIAIQLGSILAVFAAYRERFWREGVGFLRREPAAIAFVRNLLLGFLPAAVVGFFAYDFIRELLESPMVVAIALIAGGVVILLVEWAVTPRPDGTIEGMGWVRALGVGALQCLAMIPGVSRSGATIIGGLAMGMDRKTATEFSFFLAMPTMLAATLYSLWKERHHLNSDSFLLIAIGFLVAFLSALVVVRWFVRFVSKHGFAPFAWYRIVVGAIAVVWLLAR